MKLLLAVVSDMRSLTDSLQALADAVGNESDVPAEAEKPAEAKEQVAEKETAEEQKLTLEDVRAVLAEKNQNGLTAEVRTLINKYGGSRLSDLDPVNYADLIRDAEVLGNG